MLSVRCLSVLSVMFVHCGQTVWRIKTKLGMRIGLGPGHIVLDGDPASQLPLAQRGTAPQIFGPCLLLPNGWLDEAGTWHGGRPQLRRLCVIPGDFVRPSLPSQQRGQSTLPIFGPFLLCLNGWMHQDATRHGGRPQPRRVCVRWGPSPSQKGMEPLPNFKGLDSEFWNWTGSVGNFWL